MNAAAIVLHAAVLQLTGSLPLRSVNAAPTLRAHGDAAAGHVTLEWEAPDGLAVREFLLQESLTDDFAHPRTRYQGRQQSSVLSGLPNGAYHFRVRSRSVDDSSWGAWSPPKVFSVEHHSLRLAVTLFAIGAIAFGLTVSFLLFFGRKVSS